MNETTRRTIALIGAICVLGVTVAAATAQAELVTPHAASPQLITPQTAAPAPPATDPAPPAEPVEETAEEEQTMMQASSAAPAPATGEPTPRLQADAEPQDRPSSDDGSDPKPGETLIEFGERTLSRFRCPFFFPLAQQQRAEDAARYARQAAIGILVGFDSTQEESQQITNTFVAVLESHSTQGFIRSCLTTLIP